MRRSKKESKKRKQPRCDEVNEEQGMEVLEFSESDQKVSCLENYAPERKKIHIKYTAVPVISPDQTKVLTEASTQEESTCVQYSAESPESYLDCKYSPPSVEYRENERN